MIATSSYTLSVKADSDNYVVKSFDIKIDAEGNILFNVNELIDIVKNNFNDNYSDDYDNKYIQTFNLSIISSDKKRNEIFLQYTDNIVDYLAINDNLLGAYGFNINYDISTNKYIYTSYDNDNVTLPLDFTIYYIGIDNDPVPDNDNNLFILVASTIALIIVVALSLIFKIKWLLIPASLLVLIPIIYVDNLLFKTSLVIVFIALIFITFYQEKGDQFE